MSETTKTVAQFISDFKALDYCCHRIIELNEELEELNQQLVSTAHPTETLSKEQMKSKYPMPTYQRTFTSNLAMYETIYDREEKIKYYRYRIYECKAAELLSLNDLNILFDLYLYRKPQCDVAYEYGFSRSGLKKHVHLMIKSIL